ncbi:MAG: hypothetical protein KJ749_05040, partial [Planctomycetes bacterium]|nr:hypothetical protein [Planctomycetota bacterium]
MPKFYNSDLADLAHQLELSPRRLRVEQVLGIERLLGLIEDDRAYPFEFVCHAITKFHKKGTPTSALIPASALVADLVTMAEMITRGAGVHAKDLGQSYQTHEEVAGELRVSTKTVRRWRSRGLMGIRAVCDDGVNRLVFCRRTIDRFSRQNQALVARGASFCQLSAAERSRIVDRAREVLEDQSPKLHALARQLAEETGRAVETIRYTLRRHDEAHPEAALFADRQNSALDEQTLALWRCHEAGETTAAIASAFECSEEQVAQTLRRVQLQLWKESPLEYIPNELFDAPGVDALILEVSEPPAAELTRTRIPRGIPAYLRALYMTPLLTREQEQDIFRRYNYLKYKVVRAVESADLQTVSQEQIEAIRAWMKLVESINRRIVQANLRLVVGVAKKHVGWSPDFFEVISDGNMSLMRAVEKFDYGRGNKFSTYATWAIMKNFARSIPGQRYHGHRYVTGQDAVLENVPDQRPEPASPSDKRRVRELIAEGLS